jgi:superfamily I DNA/RNA helicase
MTVNGPDVPVWRLCESAWMTHLAAQGYVVTRLTDALRNSVGTKAPLIQIGYERFRAPDIQTMRAGVTSYWEVKHRRRADIDPLTGAAEYWMSYDALAHYSVVGESSGAQIWIVLHDGGTWEPGGRWMLAPLAAVRETGRRTLRIAADGAPVDAWVWPADAMEITPGPPVRVGVDDVPPFPVIGHEVPIAVDLLIPVERELRRPRSAGPAGQVSREVAGLTDVLREDARASLAVLCRALGVPSEPHYSVLRVGIGALDLDDLLGLVQYGIRVFLITSEAPVLEMPEERLEAFQASRLLEWAIVDDLGDDEFWVVDGRLPSPLPPTLRQAMLLADSAGGFNLGQYRIVHADNAADVLVAAGAGTGKTETMAERLVFLLATSVTRSDPREAAHLDDLRLDDCVLVTFTREAAREMRARIARTLTLRLRLCPRCVLPALAWLMQLSNAEVETIHGYAKKLLSREGSRLGLAPDFSVGARTMEFQALVYRALSSRVGRFMTDATANEVPPIHELRDHIGNLWQKLSSNGLSPLSLLPGGPDGRVDWGDPPEGLGGALAEACSEAIDEIAERFRDVCVETQTVPVSELVSHATTAVIRAASELRRAPRYLFIDEFQDTDGEQMELALALRRLVGAVLFVVGDDKQGIYRFRGAQGNAFIEFGDRMAAATLPPPLRRPLTRNFRSGARLLGSLDPLFSNWGSRDLLPYSPASRLLPDPSVPDASRPIEITTVRRDEEREETVRRVRQWLDASDDTRIGVLCRRNADALEYRDVLHSSGISCELRIGGSFFQCPAVREIRVLLEAVLDPTDDAAALELCETRWFSGLSTMSAPAILPAEHARGWGEERISIMSWAERLSSLGHGSVDRSDLEPLRARLNGLAAMLTLQPTLGWLVACDEWMQPKSCSLPGPGDEAERQRYARCFDHLVTLLDDAFGAAPVSAHQVLEWIRLKIATDSTEDEPAPDDGGPIRVTALTIHKAKGLEYDCVILPRTSIRFDAAARYRDMAVVPVDSGVPRFIWKWQTRSGQEFTNVAPADRSLWEVERQERVREEARLLYVALTRARQELVALVPHGSRPASPNRWADLLMMGSGR